MKLHLIATFSDGQRVLEARKFFHPIACPCNFSRGFDRGYLFIPFVEYATISETAMKKMGIPK